MRSIGRGSRILVTGGAGFVGAQLVRRLRAEEMVVRVLDDLSSGTRAHLDNVEHELMVGDVRSERSVREAVEGVDAVIHLAVASPVGSPRAERLAHDVNVTGTLNLLAAAARAKIGRFILASSSAVYGARVSYLLHEDMAPCPSTAEGAQKAAAEGYARLYSERDSLPTTILRLFPLYGPDREVGIVASFIAAARAGEPLTIYGDGTQTRDLLHVEDGCRRTDLQCRLGRGGRGAARRLDGVGARRWASGPTLRCRPSGRAARRAGLGRCGRRRARLHRAGSSPRRGGGLSGNRRSAGAHAAPPAGARRPAGHPATDAAPGDHAATARCHRAAPARRHRAAPGSASATRCHAAADPQERARQAKRAALL
jgi:UDP-glucose 4-epimerase